MLVVLSGGTRNGRIYYVDTHVPSVDFDNGPGRPSETYVRSEPEESTSTALGAALVFRLAEESTGGHAPVDLASGPRRSVSRPVRPPEQGIPSLQS